MNLYFAAFSTSPATFQHVDHPYLLESFLYMKNKKHIHKYMTEKGFKNDYRLFLDSGAFSALTRGIDISIDEYAEFIKLNKDYITVYANLDVIGDYEATLKNQAYLESKGLKPLATFHAGSPLHVLEEMCEKYDYIALGGLVPLARQRKKLQSWLDKCFKIILAHRKKTGKMVKVHGFGVNAYWAWTRYPFYSVDATSWQAAGRFAETYEFDGERPVRNSSKLTRFKMNNLTYQMRFLESVEVLIKSSEFITRLWKTRGFSWE